MDIERTVSDAEFLFRAGRRLSALTLILTAVAASSVRAYPSASTDRLRFTQFLGGRLRRILFGGYEDRLGKSGLEVKTTDHRGVVGTIDLAAVLYHLYRCPLIHESELPDHVEFFPDEDTACDGLQLGVFDDRIRLGHGLFPVLVDVVRKADCNAEMYGRQLLRFQPVGPLDEDRFRNTLLGKWNRERNQFSHLSQDRYGLLKQIVRVVGPQVIQQMSDEQLIDCVQERGPAILGGGIVAIRFSQLVDEHDRLTPSGLDILRSIAGAYALVEVTFVPT